MTDPRSGGTPAAMSESPSVAAWIRALPKDALMQVVNAHRDGYEAELYEEKTKRTRVQRHADAQAAGIRAMRDALLSLAPPEPSEAQNEAPSVLRKTLARLLGTEEPK